MVGVVAWASFTCCQPIVPLLPNRLVLFPFPLLQPQRAAEQGRQVAANSFLFSPAGPRPGKSQIAFARSSLAKFCRPMFSPDSTLLFAVATWWFVLSFLGPRGCETADAECGHQAALRRRLLSN